MDVPPEEIETMCLARQKPYMAEGVEFPEGVLVMELWNRRFGSLVGIFKT